MGLTIDEIKADEHFEYKGNLRVTGNIGANATVIVRDGDLTVEGSVGDYSDIKLPVTPIGGFIVSNASLEVRGNVGKNVKINSDAVSIHVAGSIGENCNFNNKSGDIIVGNVGNYSTLKSMSGDIIADNVGTDCTLKTMSGDVKAEKVLQNSRLETMSGNVKVDEAHSSVSLRTMSGVISENGVRRRAQPNYQGGTISIGSIGVFGDSFRLVRQAQSSTPAPRQEEAPVRYNKRHH